MLKIIQNFFKNYFMKMKHFKPTSPGLRHKFTIMKNLLGNQGLPVKGLSKYIGSSFGRNHGKISF